MTCYVWLKESNQIYVFKILHTLIIYVDIGLLIGIKIAKWCMNINFSIFLISDILFFFSLVQQYKLSKYCEEIFGDLLLTRPIPDSDVSMWSSKCYLTGSCTITLTMSFWMSCVQQIIKKSYEIDFVVFCWKQCLSEI